MQFSAKIGIHVQQVTAPVLPRRDNLCVTNIALESSRVVSWSIKEPSWKLKTWRLGLTFGHVRWAEIDFSLLKQTNFINSQYDTGCKAKQTNKETNYFLY